jgi:uncharacterized protein YijF (DUF1287 family)
MTYFERHAIKKEITANRKIAFLATLSAGTWEGVTHIGIVVDRGRWMGSCQVVHNIGAGQVVEDCL